MKFGAILNTTTMNIGDDIQTYASTKFLPQVDYVIPREHMDSFRSENNEPVAVIMSAWWMWKKWNWPPAECIIPKLVSMHINNYGVEQKGSPIYNEWLQGIGGKFFKENGPVGVRDKSSLDFFTEQGFESYFSGCITLTLPKQKVTQDAGKYVCLVDLSPSLEEKAREFLKDSGLEIRIITHNCDYRNSNVTFEKRMKITEEYLTLYQNAKFVITRRLHVSLPCLAMGVPVLAIVNLKKESNSSRWMPYEKWVRHVSAKNFKTGNFKFDFQNPPANKTDYLDTRENLIKDITDFVNQMKDCNLPIEQIKKTSYTEEEARIWQNELMHITLDKWMQHSHEMLGYQTNLNKQIEVYRQIISQMDDGDDLLKEIDKNEKKKNKALKIGQVLYPKVIKLSEKLHIENTVMKIVKKMKSSIKD